MEHRNNLQTTAAVHRLSDVIPPLRHIIHSIVGVAGGAGMVSASGTVFGPAIVRRKTISARDTHRFVRRSRGELSPSVVFLVRPPWLDIILRLPNGPLRLSSGALA